MIAWLLLGCVGTTWGIGGHGGDGPADGESAGEAPRPGEEEDPTASGDPIDGAEVLFADGEIHDIDITLDDDAWHDMESDWTAVVEATVTIDGDEYARAGIHRKGSSSLRNLGAKAAFSVDLGEFGEDGYHGVRRFLLNNMVWDPSMIREHVAAWFFAEMGVPAARHGYARVRVNGALFGLYGIVEAADQRFIDTHWGWDREGWLYDSGWANADFSTLLAVNFTVQEEGAYGAPFQDLWALVSQVETTAPGNGLALLESRFDAEEFIRGQATEIVLGNYDSYWYNLNNYLVYHAPRSDRWHMIPWGQDQALTGNGNIYGPYKGALDVLCAGDGACRDLLTEDMREAGEALVSLNATEYVRQTWDLVKPDCEADPRREKPCDPGTVFDFVAVRPETVRSELE